MINDVWSHGDLTNAIRYYRELGMLNLAPGENDVQLAERLMSDDDEFGAPLLTLIDEGVSLDLALLTATGVAWQDAWDDRIWEADDNYCGVSVQEWANQSRGHFSPKNIRTSLHDEDDDGYISVRFELDKQEYILDHNPEDGDFWIAVLQDICWQLSEDLKESGITFHSWDTGHWRLIVLCVRKEDEVRIRNERSAYFKFDDEDSD